MPESPAYSTIPRPESQNRKRLWSSVNNPPPTQPPSASSSGPQAPYTGYHGPVEPRLLGQITTAPHATLPNNTAPTCPFDTAVLDFIAVARRYINSGSHQPGDLTGPDAEPDLTPLYSPDRYSTEKQKGTSIIVQLTELLRGFSNVSRWPEKIGIVYVGFFMLRWRISPTLEHYNMMPEHIRPTVTQIKEPHPLWIDTIPWPDVRDRLITQYPGLGLEHFFYPYSLTISANWPYEDDIFACLFEERVPGEAPRIPPPKRTPGSTDITGSLRVLPKFKEHILKLDNWSLGPQFQQTFPRLITPQVRIVDNGRKPDL